MPTAAPDGVAEVMHVRPNHPNGGSACQQECGAGKDEAQEARRPREEHG
jgi:hypothetical protein